MYIQALTAVSATTTSTPVDVSNIGNLCIQLTAPTFSSGSGTFTILGSNDGVNFVTLAVQDNTTAPTTWITSKALSSATSALVWVMAPVKIIEITCTVTGTGTYSAVIFGNKMEA